jgi:hypothetical protein
MARGPDNISNTSRPNEFKYWMIGISLLCTLGLLAGIFPTFGSIMDYFWVTMIIVAVGALVTYGVREVIKEKRFWNSTLGDEDYDRYSEGPR